MSKSVLIIDDESLILELVEDCLEDSFDIIDSALGLEEAKELLHEKMYSCILLDIELTDGNGGELVAYLREVDPGMNKETPVILMSAHLTNDFVSRHQDQFAGFLFKPFSKKDLDEVLEEIISADEEVIFSDDEFEDDEIEFDELELDE